MGSYNNFSRRKQANEGLQDPATTHAYSVTKKNELHLKNIDGWARQINFWRTHLDVFIEDYFKVKLYPFQQLVVRDIGNCIYVFDDESRGLGKTFKMALVLPAFCVLYPGIECLVVSRSARQAVITVKKVKQIYDSNEQLRREVKGDIKISKDRGIVNFKNGSTISAMAAGAEGDSIRGERFKIIFMDEAAFIDDDYTRSLRPTLNSVRLQIMHIRQILDDENYPSEPSRFIESSSANFKYTKHFGRMKEHYAKMLEGSPSAVYNIPYTLGLRHNLFDEGFIKEEKSSLPKEVFSMEYDCKHLGSGENGFFDFTSINNARTIDSVELQQPKNSKSRYIMIVDVATGKRKDADNSCIGIIKFNEKPNGTFDKRLVYVRTIKGENLGTTADEIRILHARFPNIEKIIVDINGVGEGIPPLLETPYIDPETGKEFPILVDENEIVTDEKKAKPIIRSFRGSNELNNRGATAIKLYLEKGDLHLPLPTSMVKDKVKTSDKGLTRDRLIEEKAIFHNTDALTMELLDIRAFKTKTTWKYDVPRGKHKDRYSVLMMGCLYLYELEEENREDKRNNEGRPRITAINFNVAKKVR